MRKLLSFLSLIFVLAACAPAAATVPPTAPATLVPTVTIAPPATAIAAPAKTGWWTDAVFYEIFVRSFYDSNGDGKGDLKGVTAKLDYLSQLGIKGVWLMPINPSPSYHGYDVIDHRGVNPDYGTLDDLKQLLSEAHKRGIKIILDFVINHTSNQSPWHIAALDPKSDKHDWYIWSDTDPGYLGPFDERVWYKDLNAGAYYYAIFDPVMPDLNYRNPAVTKEMESVASFWLKDVGVDGLRVDGARYLIEEGKAQADTPATHAWYQQFYQFYKNINPNALTIGEVWTDVASTAPYVKDNELDLVFNFDLASTYISGVSSASAFKLREGIKSNLSQIPFNQYGSFLTNHDMDRAMSQFSGDAAHMKTAATLYLTGPGVPFIYYGEEIGMIGKKPDEDIRTPMQWTADSNAGFTTGKPWEPVNGDYKDTNVAVESLDPNALLPLYRRLIALRNDHVALRQGDYMPIDAGNSTVYAALRATKDEAILIVLNLSDSPQKAYGLTLSESTLRGKYTIDPLLGASAGSYAPLTVGPAGEFENYMPLPELPAGARLVLKLTP